jgi:hypothetical protein
MTASDEKLPTDKVRAAATRRKQMQHLNALEGNPLDAGESQCLRCSSARAGATSADGRIS